MKIAIVGFDREGRATYDFLQNKGHDITVCDQNNSLVTPKETGARLGDSYLDSLDAFDMVVRTPGLHPSKILEKNPGILDKITTQTNLFFEHCPTKNVIGVTGTKGKGTTSTLIARMLEAAGMHVVLGGNIGIPMLDLLGELTPESWVVLELSSFQLIDIRYSPHIATVLMVEPEHLNWHEDFEEYIAAKQQLFIHQGSQDIAIYFSKNENSESIADASVGMLIPYYKSPGAQVVNGSVEIDGKQICHTDELKLLGQHNWQNACAAVTTVWQVTQNIDAIRSVLATFSGLEHRLEFVAEVDGVSYYDDSFGTTPQTAQVAIEAFVQPKVIILGGSNKGSHYDSLIETILANDVRAVVEMGEMGPIIAGLLQQKGYANIVPGGESMKQIVTAAQKEAQSGDVVLLSTACASFGLFKDYKDRGNQFKSCVTSLK